MTETTHHREDLSIDQQLALQTAAVRLGDEFADARTARRPSKGSCTGRRGCDHGLRRLPDLPRHPVENWELDDPAGKTVEEVRPIRDEIERPVRHLRDQLEVPATA